MNVDVDVLVSAQKCCYWPHSSDLVIVHVSTVLLNPWISSDQ